MSTWYYVEGGDRVGPVDHHTLVSKLGHGALPSDTLVWKDGMADWVAADSVAELRAPAEGIASHAAGAAGAREASFTPVTFGGPAATDAAGGFDPFSQEAHGVMPIVYAGFWKRAVASIIDSIILQVLSFAMQIAMMIVVSIPGVSDNDVIVAILMIGIMLLYFVLYFGYFAVFEAGNWQATPGKKVIGIKVTGMNGERITLGRSFGRNVAKVLSSLTFLIGYLMAGFTAKKQALHDMLAGCLVVNA